MIAQVTSSGDTAIWAGATAFFLMLLGQIGKMLTDWQKNKNQQSKDDADRQQNMLAEQAKLTALQEIARLNSNIREGQIEQNGKLAKVVEVNKAYHEELLRSQSTMCKYNKQQTINI
jgi:hypothetical protein